MRATSTFWLPFATALLVAHTVNAEVKSDPIALATTPVGSPPVNFDFWQPTNSAPRDWSVVQDSSADGQLAIRNSGSSGSSLAVYRPLSAVNVAAKLRFKLLEGKRPTVGIAARIIDADDYYIVRVDAIGGRITFDHVAGGKSEEIAGVDADISEGHWQNLEIIANGDSFKISLDGAWAFTAFDRSVPLSGKIGLWSDQDGTALFDSIEINPLPSEVESDGRNRGMGG